MMMGLARSLAWRIGRWNWLRLGVRRRIVKFLVPQRSIKPATFETRHIAGTYQGNLSNAQDWHVYFFGGYELKELALITDLLSAIPEAVAIDVGGNQGGHALTMARIADSVHSVEPFGPLAEKIEKLVQANGLGNVTVHKVGLGDRPGLQDYYLDLESSNQGTGSFLADHNDGDVAGQLMIVRGDEYFRNIIEKVDFIKIDIEGYEAPAISGMKDILKRDKPFVLMEVTQSSAKLFEEYGGLQSCIPFPFRILEVANPDYAFGLMQTKQYQLSEIDDLCPRSASYNVLIVPQSRMPRLASSKPGRSMKVAK